MLRTHFTASIVSDQDAQRFWSKVSKGDACWTWTGAKSKLGHGRFKIGKLTHYAHRIAFAIERGQLAEGNLTQTCGNPSCVNPEHLEQQAGAKTVERKGNSVRRPKKPRAKFPLYAHNNGQWAKKIAGRTHFFGVWADPDAAEANYDRQRESLEKGEIYIPPNDGAVQVRDVLNTFLGAKDRAVASGELKQRSYDEYYGTCQRINDAFRPERNVETLTADDFAKLRASIAKDWGPVRLANEVQRVRSVFKFGFDSGLIGKPVRFGPEFRKPSKKTMRLHRAKQGEKLFTADEIRWLVNAGSPVIKAMILLGINCGFGNNDVGKLPLSALDLKGRWVNFPRPKTGVVRRCYLWPETVDALRRAIDDRPKAKDKSDAQYVFVTRWGQCWAKDSTAQPLAQEVGKLLESLDINGRKGVGFYTLRHTFRTIADETRDFPAIDRIMGHAPPDGDMGDRYRERIGDDRIKAVAEHVRKWLFVGKKKSKTNHGKTG